jgi:hypothetical protein
MAHSYSIGKTTLVVLPMLSMHEQYIHRCALLNIPCNTWTPRLSETNSPAIVLVPVELTQSHIFREYSRRLFGLSLLSRIFLDEVHLFETHASFRDVMDTIAWLAGLGVQICAVSATVPIAFEPILFRRFGVTTYETIRIWTPRPEISYNVHVVVDRRAAVIQKYHECLASTGAHEGILVFCNTVPEAESLAKDLDLAVIHGRLEPAELAHRINSLRTRESKNAVCTPVLGVAFDVPGITYVLQNGCPRNAADHEQQTGRCGRAGKTGWVHTFVAISDTYPVPPEPDYWGVEAVRTHTTETHLCRRVRPNLALHGVSLTCVELTPYNPCDVCEQEGLKDGKIKESSAYPPVLVQKYLSPIDTLPDVSIPSQSIIASSSISNTPEKPLPDLPNFTSSISPTNPSTQSPAIQISTQLSQSTFASQPFLPHSEQLHALRNALDYFSTSCVDCWLHQRTDSPNHSFEHCVHQLTSQPAYQLWCSQLVFPTGICYGCACPQYVCGFIYSQTTAQLYFSYSTPRPLSISTSSTTGSPITPSPVNNAPPCSPLHLLLRLNQQLPSPMSTNIANQSHLEASTHHLNYG